MRNDVKKNAKKRQPLIRLVRGALFVLLACAVLATILAYAPFMRQPTVDAETAAWLDARAEEMQRGIETGDRAAILESSLEGLEERLRLIAQAQHEIVIVTYECHDGESTRDILAAALRKADEGVRVRFLVDGIAGRLDHMDEALFRAAAIHPNVEVRFYNLIRQYAPWKSMGRMHDKYVIVDDLAYILGGRNMFDKFLGEYPAPVWSLDREALVYNSTDSADSSLHALREYFEGMWAHEETTVYNARKLISDEAAQAVFDELSARCARMVSEKPELFAPCDYADMTMPTDGIWLVTNPTTIYAKQPTVFYQLMALMLRAREGVIIHSPYAVLNRAMREGLAAVTARVPVTLMVNAVENGANLVASGDFMLHKQGVLSTDVHLLEYAGGKSYHGKAAVIDNDLSVIGSFNLDMRSAYIDTELMLVVRGEAFNAALRQNLEALHADCREVIDAKTALVSDGLTIPDFPIWKRALIALIGVCVQPVRGLV